VALGGDRERRDAVRDEGRSHRTDQGPLGRPRQRPAQWHADKAYDAQRGREDLRRRGIAWRITHQGIEASERLGRYRWGGERTLAWRNQVRRLPVRYARRATIHQAFRDLGCALIGWNLLQAVFC